MIVLIPALFQFDKKRNEDCCLNKNRVKFSIKILIISISSFPGRLQSDNQFINSLVLHMPRDVYPAIWDDLIPENCATHNVSFVAKFDGGGCPGLRSRSLPRSRSPLPCVRRRRARGSLRSAGRWAFRSRPFSAGRRSTGVGGVSELWRLRQIEKENRQLKRPVADA